MERVHHAREGTGPALLVRSLGTSSGVMRMPFDAIEDLPDEALLARFAGGDAAAARVLTLRLTPRVMAHAFRLLGNRAEAEDVTQEAMLRLWKQAPAWRDGEAKVTTWLYRVVANLCIDRQRRARGRAVTLDAIPEPADGRASVTESDAGARPRRRAAGGAERRCPHDKGRPWCCATSRVCRTPRSPRSCRSRSRRWKA